MSDLRSTQRSYLVYHPSSSRRVICWCFLAAVVINLFCNCFSPFFIPEGALDPNCFYAEGCAAAHGCLPYRDFLDVKGPLLILIYTVGYMLTPTRCGGILLLYTLATWGTLVAFYRTAELFKLSPLQAATAVALATCCLFSRFTAFWAAQPELLLAFPFAWAIYYLTAFLKDPSGNLHYPLAWWTTGGAVATFLIKFNFVIPYIAIFGTAVFVLLRQKRANEIIPFSLRCLLCTALICLPFIAYFTYHRLWEDFFYAYFQLNAEANSNQPLLTRPDFLIFVKQFINFPPLLSYAILGYCLYVACIKKGDTEHRDLIRHLAPVFVFTYASCAMGWHGYYYIMIAPLAIFPCIDVARHPLSTILLKRRLALKTFGFFALFVLLINGHCLSPLGWGRPALERQRIEEVQEMIACIPSPRIVCFDCPDIMLGKKAASIPGTAPWMYLTGVSYQTYAPRDRAIREGKVDFIITAGKIRPSAQNMFQNAGYESVPEARIANIYPKKDVQVWAKAATRAKMLKKVGL